MRIDHMSFAVLRGRVRAGAIALLAMFLLAACGGGDEATPTPTTSDSGDPGDSMNGGDGVDENGIVIQMEDESDDDYIQRLYEAAQDEGEVTYYHSANQVEIENILNNWEENFPLVEFIEVQASGGPILERLLTECRSGNTRADVFGAGAGDQLPLMDADCIVEYRPVNEKNIDPAFLFPGEPYIAVGYLTFHLAYNPDLIDEADVPTDWFTLLEPRFQGEIGGQLSGFEWFCGIKEGMGEERAQELLDGLAEQDVHMVDGSTVGAELLSAGEYSVFLDLFGHNLARYQGDGMTVEIKVPNPDPLVAVADMSSIQKDAPNPNAARLVQEFFLTPAGQDVFLSRGKATVLTEGTVEHPYGHLLEGVNIQALGPLEADFDECAREWNNALVR